MSLRFILIAFSSSIVFVLIFIVVEQFASLEALIVTIAVCFGSFSGYLWRVENKLDRLEQHFKNKEDKEPDKLND